MKKRILLTALLLPSLMFASPVNAVETIVSAGTAISNQASTGSGGVYSVAAGDSLVIEKTCEYVGNSAAGHGGVIYNAGNTTINGSSFSSNKVTGAGSAGAVVINMGGGNLTVVDSTFSKNTAGFGTIYTSSKSNTVTISGSTFSENVARGTGAVGVYSKGEITNTTFYKNVSNEPADEGGGAVSLGAVSNTVMNNVTFTENSSATVGGAIATRIATDNDNSNAVLQVLNSTFTGNTAATNGGAIDNYFYKDSFVKNTTFESNSAVQGGAVYNHGEKDLKNGSNILAFEGDKFIGNTASKHGGAIYNAGVMNVSGSTFKNNIATQYGGAVMNIASDGQVSSIKDSTFSGNQAYVGGALFSYLGTVNIDNSKFVGNTADFGGAIYTAINDNTLNIANSSFENNSALSVGAVGVFKNATITNTSFIGNKATDSTDDGAGAVLLGAASQTTIADSVFENNYSASRGGAIATRDVLQGANQNGKLDISNTSFVNNMADGNGGALYNAFYNSQTNPQNVSIVGSSFEGNKSGGNGGAIYNAATDLSGFVSSVYVTDTSFTGNSAEGEGGAIFANGVVNISAVDSDVLFANNTSGSGSNDIFMAGTNSDLNVNAAGGRDVSFTSGIDGNSYNLNINNDGVSEGSVSIGAAIRNANISVASGTFALGEGSALINSTLDMADNTTLSTISGAIEEYGSNVTLGNSVSLLADINIADGTADNFANVTKEGSVVLEGVNYLGNTTANNINIDLAKALGIDSSSLTISEALQQQTQTILTPIRYLTGSVGADGVMSFVPTGNGYKDFNPAVMTSSVAAQLGGLFTQYNSYNQAFMNMDMRMQMNRQEREALRLRNSIASADTSTPMVYSPIFQPDKNKGAWMRGYSTFESVNMDGGPKVNNVMYGTFFGGDSDMQQLENGGEIQYSVYAGYNGSHQTYSGNSMWQNGGTMGVTGAYYKENFFTALTANVGASVVDASTIFGKEDFPMLMAGIASKTGYNIELADGKFIIQPNYLMSYSFVNTFDYTNAAGVRIESDPLHSIQIAPGIKFIGNLKNGWQPYASVRMVWNLMDKTDFTAANTSLPELSIKPWVEYGVGVQKRWGERFTGFAQTMLRNGGRNGVSLGLGFRWAIGKAPEKNPNARNFTPELPKTKVSVAKFIKSSSPQPACHTHVCQPVFASHKTVR